MSSHPAITGTAFERLPQQARTLYNVIAQSKVGMLVYYPTTEDGEHEENEYKATLGQHLCSAASWVLDQAPPGELTEVAFAVYPNWTKCAFGGIIFYIRLATREEHRLVTFETYGEMGDRDAHLPGQHALYEQMQKKLGDAQIEACSEALLAAVAVRSEDDEPGEDDEKQLGTSAYYAGLLLVVADALGVTKKGFELMRDSFKVDVNEDGQEYPFWAWRAKNHDSAKDALSVSVSQAAESHDAVKKASD